MSYEPQSIKSLGPVQPDYVADNTHAERMEARMVELDKSHTLETKRLGVLITVARKDSAHLKQKGA